VDLMPAVLAGCATPCQVGCWESEAISRDVGHGMTF